MSIPPLDVFFLLAYARNPISGIKLRSEPTRENFAQLTHILLLCLVSQGFAGTVTLNGKIATFQVGCVMELKDSGIVVTNSTGTASKVYTEPLTAEEWATFTPVLGVRRHALDVFYQVMGTTPAPQTLEQVRETIPFCPIHVVERIRKKINSEIEPETTFRQTQDALITKVMHLKYSTENLQLVKRLKEMV